MVDCFVIDGFVLLTALFSLCGLFLAWQREQSKEKYYWFFLFIGVCFYILAQVITVYHHALGNSDELWFDRTYFYIFGNMLYIGAILYKMYLYAPKAHLSQLILDILITFTMIACISWVVINRTMTNENILPEIILVSSAFSFLFGEFTFYWSVKRKFFRKLHLLIFFVILCNVIADILYVCQMYGIFEWNNIWLNLPRILFYLLLGLIGVSLSFVRLFDNQSDDHRGYWSIDASNRRLSLLLHYIGIVLQWSILIIWIQNNSLIILIWDIISIILLIFRYSSIYGENSRFARIIYTSREKYREVVDSVKEVVFNVDTDGKILFLNRAWEELTEYTIQDSMGRSFRDYVIPEDRLVVEEMLQLLETKNRSEIISEEFRFKTKSNEIRWAELDIRVKFNEDNEELFYIGSFRDVTVKKQQESQLVQDLTTAKKLQKSILSRSVSSEHLSIQAYYEPSSMLSGDMYCWFKIDEHRYGIILLDVMGHGVSAALVSMSVRAILQELVINQQSPESVIQELNRYMTEMFQNDEIGLTPYFTAVYMLIDTNEQTVEYVNAGHNAGIFIQKNSCSMMTSTTIPVGITSEMPLKKEVFAYDSSAVLVLYTDGLLELISPSTQKATKTLKEYVGEKFLEGSKTLIKDIENKFIAYEASDDDVTLLVIELTPEQET